MLEGWLKRLCSGLTDPLAWKSERICACSMVIWQMTATGARPAGALDEASAAQAVRQMFDSIAPRYDLLNHLLSANVDRLWWRRTARTFQPVLARPDSAILDI